MIRSTVAISALVMLCLAGCDVGGGSKGGEKDETSAATAPGAPSVAPAPAAAPAGPPVVAMAANVDAYLAPGAPPFAALYPGATLDEPATVAAGDAGQGGLATFHADAQPDQIVTFYRERAEAAGLTSVMGMNQGAARAYGAAGAQPNGPSLQVVASPAEAGGASVQVTWSEGR